MATSFPTGLDTFYDPAGTDNLSSAGGIGHAAIHTNVNDAVAALEAYVGVTGSAVTSSLTYKLNNVPAGGYATPGFLRSPTSIATYNPAACANSTGSIGSHTYLMPFTAPVSLTTTHVKYIVTAAGSTGTVSLYSLDSSDNGTLIASVTGSIFGSTGVITQSWAASATVTAGTRYAIGFTAAAGTPTFQATSIAANSTETLAVPFLTGQLSTATPSTFLQSALSANSFNIYAVIS
jgi:hypothetical protein